MCCYDVGMRAARIVLAMLWTALAPGCHEGSSADGDLAPSDDAGPEGDGGLLDGGSPADDGTVQPGDGAVLPVGDGGEPHGPAWPGELYGVFRAGTGSAKTELHVLDGASAYHAFLQQTATALPETGVDAGWAFLLTDFDHDDVPDLVAVQKAGAPSGQTEVRVLSGAGGFQQQLLPPTATALPSTGTDDRYVFLLGDQDLDGVQDLFVVDRASTSGKTAVTVLGGPAFTTTLLSGPTSLDASGTDSSVAFLLGDRDRDGTLDLYVVAKSGTASQTTEVRVLDGKSGFTTSLLSRGTALPVTGADDRVAFLLGDYDLDGQLDLYAVIKSGTGSGQTEVHVLSGADLDVFLLHTATPLAPTGSDRRWLYALAATRLPRIGVRAASPVGQFYDRRTGLEVRPAGNNHLREETSGALTTHAVGVYDPVALEATFARMHADGYDTVRTLLWQGDTNEQCPGTYPCGVAGPPASLTLYRPALANFVDYVRRARNHGLRVQVVLGHWPMNTRFDAFMHAVPGVQCTIKADPNDPFCVNLKYLSADAIEGKRQYVSEVVRAVAGVEQGGLLSTILAWEIENEVHVNLGKEPFSLTSGTVTTADGATYDLAQPAQRDQCASSNIVHWANVLAGEIHSIDPRALVSASAFTFAAVGRAGPNGAPAYAGSGDPRYPMRPAIIRTYSDLSFTDLHTYPSGGGYTLQADLDSSEFSSFDKTTKPLYLGEYGAFRSIYSLAQAVPLLVAHRDAAIQLGFRGLLHWTWDLPSNVPGGVTYSARDGGGMLEVALEP